jgi:protein-tyrosine phosphatase
VSLGRSNYLLVEFPAGILLGNEYELINRLQTEGFIPILAHPEKNISFVKEQSLLLDFARRGCMVQLDAGSVLGIYGEKTRNCAKHLLVSGIVDFIASDAQRAFGYADLYLKAYRTVTGWIGVKKADKLFYSTARMILEAVEKNIMKPADV